MVGRYWIITEFHGWKAYDGEANEAEKTEGVGVESAEPTGSDLPVKFRMFDDDDNLVYVGLAESSDGAVAAFDNYGTPNWGCTRIDISYDNGETWLDFIG
jgi:hypothetical protein